jgi:hypothetical protein
MNNTEPRQTIRIWVKTHRLLRILAAYTGESMVAAVHRLVQAEYERVMEVMEQERPTR